MTVALHTVYKMPIDDAVADFRLSPDGDATTLTLDVQYRPNRLGRVTKRTTDKQMRKGMGALADDLARESERVAAATAEEVRRGTA